MTWTVFQSLCLRCPSHCCWFLSHVLFGRKKKGAPVYVCKSVSVQLLLQAGMEEAASTRLLCLMSTWIQRDFGMTGISSAGHGCLCSVSELREAAVSSPGVNQSRDTRPGEFTACVRSPCCHPSHTVRLSLGLVCCSALSLDSAAEQFSVLACLCVCSDSAFLKTARLYGCAPVSF